MKNMSNENCNVILREKINDNNFSKKNYLNDLFNENFLKDNEKILLNHLQDTKKNFRTSYMDIASTKYSTKGTKGFFNDNFDMKNNLTSFKLNETLKNKESKKLGESIL